MDSPFPLQDLNLALGPPSTFISPKLEPKTEPEELPLLQNPNPNFLQEISSRDESDVYAEFFRVSEMFRSALAARASRDNDVTLLDDRPLSIVPAPNQDVLPSTLSPRQKQQRSSELVRVSILTLPEERYFRDLIRKTRLLYESLRIFLIQEDSGAGEASGLPLRGRRRGDLRASAIMMDRGLWLNRDKRIVGAIPGVYVGDSFFFRMEMCVIGLHGQVQAGIDYVGAARTPSAEPIATSIIVSGGYEDDEDSGDVLIYTGHGGKDRGLMRHSVHQKLEGGNLALERSLHYGIEIRVIRGIKSDRSPSGKVYVYDGLYRITGYWLDVGKSGFGVYKYKLLRLPDQPEMGTLIFKYAQELKTRPLSVRPAGYMSLDISQGKEKFPVYLFNDLDSDQGPLLFKYADSPVYPPYGFSGGGIGCGCTLNCSNCCYCIKRNGGEMIYDSNGILLRGRPVIYECGASCRCPPSCSNRASQRGLRSRLEVFRSQETGWGVRSLDVIRAGEFICEYTGIVLPRQLASVVSMNGDSLIHPSRFPPRWMEWGDLSHIFPSYLQPEFPSLPPLDFALDVSRIRNVACYFSHSCSPNVMVQFVYYLQSNAMYPHIALFAMENIPPMRELSIDYGVTSEWTEDPLAIDIK